MPASALPDNARLRLTRRDALKTFTLITGGTLVTLGEVSMQLAGHR